MLEIGKKAPDFTLLNQDNESMSLSDFKGKKVLVISKKKVQIKLVTNSFRKKKVSSFKGFLIFESSYQVELWKVLDQVMSVHFAF